MADTLAGMSGLFLMFAKKYTHIVTLASRSKQRQALYKERFSSNRRRSDGGVEGNGGRQWRDGRRAQAAEWRGVGNLERLAGLTL
jgi:hypothetical protein